MFFNGPSKVSSSIDLRLFHPSFRQALVFSMIEGLLEGYSFSFIDNGDADALQLQLSTSDLRNCTWEIERTSGLDYKVIFQKSTKSPEARNQS